MNHRLPRILSAVSVLALGAGLVIAPLPSASAAHADVPPVAASEFFAEQCVGTTMEDPTDARVQLDPDDADSPLVPGPVPDLTRVWGPRLADYNAGHVVALYSAFGNNQTDGYPPVCGVRYVESEGGPVSEWMFCTHIWRSVCSGADADGNLLDKAGNVIPGHRAVGGNADLTPDQERLIAYLIRNGVPSYSGVGYYDYGVSEARADAGSYERMSLQVLIWCITDPVTDLNATNSEDDRAATCAALMPPEEQERLLALIPETPEVTLDFDEAGAPEVPGTPLVATLTTNIYEQPIRLDVTGGASVEVVSGDAVLSGSTLTVAAAADSATIVLRVTPASDQPVEVAATARPTQRSALTWNQPGVDEVCQVFATFSELDAPEVSDSTRLAYRSATQLARTGVELATGALAAALALLALGTALVVRRRAA